MAARWASFKLEADSCIFLCEEQARGIGSEVNKKRWMGVNLGFKGGKEFVVAVVLWNHFISLQIMDLKEWMEKALVHYSSSITK